MTQASCHTCIYACWDLGQAMLSMSTGFASRPMCANHPDAPALMRPTPLGGVCRNYRARAATPEGDVKRIPLGGGQYAYVDAADYEWLSQYHWSLQNGGYAVRREGRKAIYMHREIMQPPEGMIVDHIDGNKVNNCRFNVRVCTRAENCHNRAKCGNSASRFKGVGYVKSRDKYWARFQFNGERLCLGYFDDELDAARAYDRKAVECSGPFARLNFPEEWPPERIQEVYRPPAGLRAHENKGAKGVKGEEVRKGKGESRHAGRGWGKKRRTENGRRRTPREQKARRPERHARRPHDARRNPPDAEAAAE